MVTPELRLTTVYNDREYFMDYKSDEKTAWEDVRLHIMDKEAFLAITEDQAIKIFRLTLFVCTILYFKIRFAPGTSRETCPRLASTTTARRRARRARRRRR